MQKNENIEVDEDFNKIGEFGPYQCLILVLVGLVALAPAYLSHGYVFIAGTPDSRCRIPGLDNDTFEIQNDAHQALIDKYIVITDSKYDKCNMYNFNVTDYDVTSNDTFIKCDSWVFSKEYYGKTIVNDWELVCEKSAKKSAISSMYFLGTIGVIFIGVISDKIGRKKTAYGLIMLNVIINILIAVVVNLKLNTEFKIFAFGLLRLLNGLSTNLYSVAVVLAMEVIGPSYRVLAANSVYYFYILGEYIIVILSYYIRDYDHMFIVLASIISIYPLYFWFIPESPRWQLARGHNEAAYKTLKRIAKSNNRELPKNYEKLLLNTLSVSESKLEKNDAQNHGFCSTIGKIARSRVYLIRTMAVSFNWLTNSLVYYGLTLGTGQLAGNPYLNFTFLATTEFAAILISQFAFQRIGRKLPYVLCMTIAGISMLVVCFIPKFTIMALIGKFTISLTYNGAYIFTNELYPTVVRNSALSLCQVSARFGSFLSPYINLLGEMYFNSLPFMIYGSCGIISSILTVFFIPETKGRSLPDTISDL